MTWVVDDTLVLSNEHIVDEWLGHRATPKHATAHIHVRDDELVVLPQALVVALSLVSWAHASVNSILVDTPHVLNSLFDLLRASQSVQESG